MIRANENNVKKTDKDKRDELGELEDYFEMVDSSQGKEFVIKDEDRKVEESVIVANRELNILDRAQGEKEYRSRVAELGNSKIPKLDLPEGWVGEFLPTDGTNIHIHGKSFATKPGIVFILKDPKEGIYIRAISLSSHPVIDRKAIMTLLQQAENTVDSAEGKLLSDEPNIEGFKKTKSGLYLP